MTIDLNSIAHDGSEQWFTLGNKEGSKATVSGDICLSFSKGAVSQSSGNKSSSRRGRRRKEFEDIFHIDSFLAALQRQRSATTIVEHVKAKIDECNNNGGTELDLGGCDLNKIPNVILFYFSSVDPCP